jgi:hypothetical protein
MMLARPQQVSEKHFHKGWVENQPSCPGGGISNFSNFFVHIPKTGGNSAYRLLEKDQEELCPGARTNNHYVQNATKKWNKWYKSCHNSCTLHLSESPYISIPEHTYTIVRDPQKHVLSQYFHCTESKFRKKDTWQDMPSLDLWLEYWIQMQQIGMADKTASNYPLLYTYDCYKPINLQTTMLGGTSDLEQRFDVIGIQSRLETSTCLISISIMGKVPSRCNCTEEGKEETTAALGIDHGVVHHGDTFVVTEKQKSAIASLTEEDSLLYKTAEDMFQHQVKEVERLHSIKLC